jgi:adenine deaminase
LYIEETIAAVWGGNVDAFEEFISQPRMRYVHPLEVAVWRRGVTGSRWNPVGSFPGQLDSRVEFIKQYAREFIDAGVPFTLGTDSPTVLGVPGFSTHQEMRLLGELGLTPFQTLEIATKNGGAFINETLTGSESFGVIAPGQRADLILLSANPLDDIVNVQARVGVMARGQWWSENALQALLEAVAKSYGN